MKLYRLPHSWLTPTFLAATIAFALAASLQAQTKIAVVDLKKVFDGYYKTKQADAQLKERGAEADKILKGMMDDYQKSSDEYKKLVEGANDQAVSSDERDKRKKTAESKLLELQEIERSVAQFRRDTQNRFEEQMKRMRDNILREIRDVVATKAKAGNFTLVLDTASESANRTPVVVYTSGQDDLTDSILTELNTTAPASILAPEKPAATPAPEKPARK